MTRRGIIKCISFFSGYSLGKHYLCSHNFQFCHMKLPKELYITAAVSSFIIAFYGVIPFYVFDRPETLYSIRMFLGLAVMIFMAWLLLFFLVRRFPQWGNAKLFCVSMLGNIAARAVFAGLGMLDFFPTGFLPQEFIYLVSTLFPINGILIIILKSTITILQNTETERQLQEIKIQNAEAHTKILIQQLHPHFLFNSLSVLKSLISENPKVAEDYVVKLSQFLRYSIEASSSDLINLENELEFAKRYIELQKGRFENAFTYFIQIEDKYLETKLPIMALQVVVENIFKHNYFTKQKTLTFSLKIEDDFLIVKNTKTVIRQIDSTQTGLSNLNKRYELLAQKTIIIENTPNYFVVKLPLL